MTIEGIRDKVKEGDYRFSDHAVKMMIVRSMKRADVESAIITGEIIEEYPDDKYSPSCLVYGKSGEGRDLHVQVSLPPRVVVVTAYEPDPAEWIDCRKRR